MESDSLKYFMTDYWHEHGDPFTSQMPGMKTPWVFSMIGLNLVFFCKYFGPKWMENRKPANLKPLMVILNGLCFGAYTAGVLLGIYLTGGFVDCMDCRSYAPDSDDLRVISMKYLGYVMVFTKVFDFARPVLSVLSKKNYQVTNLQLIHLQCSLMLTWCGVKLNPGGVFILLALNDTLYQLLVSSYLVMAASSTEMHPSPSFRNVFVYFRILTAIVTSPHQLYFYFTQNDCTGSYPLLLGSGIYVALVGILYPVDFYFRTRTKFEHNHCKKIKQFEKLDANENAIAT
jgi:hypothetical protein